MQTGDVVFVRDKGLLNDLITSVDKGQFDHVALFVSETEIIEANYDIKVEIDKFSYPNYEIISLNLNEEQQAKVLELSKKYIGKKYDFMEILDIFLRKEFNLTFLEKLNNESEVICSELVADILEGIGILEKGAELLAPNELYTLLKSKGY